MQRDRQDWSASCDGEETKDTLDLHVLRNAMSGSDILVFTVRKTADAVTDKRTLCTIATSQCTELRLTEPPCQIRMLFHVCLH